MKRIDLAIDRSSMNGVLISFGDHVIKVADGNVAFQDIDGAWLSDGEVAELIEALRLAYKIQTSELYVFHRAADE